MKESTGKKHKRQAERSERSERREEICYSNRSKGCLAYSRKHLEQRGEGT